MSYISYMVIIETPTFTKRITRLMSDEVYRSFQNALLKSTDLGDIIKNNGGIRKIRWSGIGREKEAVLE